MAKLKKIIQQLASDDYQAIYNSLMESSAEKSAYLLKAMRERQTSDNKIIGELDVNTNAYYTLRSRLNQKIEEHLLQQMEDPRTDILKKVANINEIIFTKNRTIAIATLKKLEKDLLDYDLSNELTVIYKLLKKLHVHSPDHYNYSQLYNKHVAYMLAVDKAEDMLSSYFKKYGQYAMSGDETEQLELTLMAKEINNLTGLYHSHRLYVYGSCINIFHRLFVEEDDLSNRDIEPLEDILKNADEIFDNYPLDPVYFHLKTVFEFLKLEYYKHYKVIRKAEEFYNEVCESANLLLSNFSLYTYPPQLLISMLQWNSIMDTHEDLYEINIAQFESLEINKDDVPLHITYYTYRAMSCYFTRKYEEAAQWLNNLLNEISLKKYPYTQLEIKILLATQYCLMDDYDLFNQLINSIQRQLRIIGKENIEHIGIMVKLLKTAFGNKSADKQKKLEAIIPKLQASPKAPYEFSPTKLFLEDKQFIERLIK